MYRVFIATRTAEQRQFLERLAAAGVLQIEPCNPEAAVADASALNHLEVLRRNATPTLPATVAPDNTALALEIAALETTLTATQEELNRIQHQIQELGQWGTTSRAALEVLETAGVSLRIVQCSGIKPHAELVIALDDSHYLLIDGANVEPLNHEMQELPRPARDYQELNAARTASQAKIIEAQKRLAELRPQAAAAALALETACALQIAERAALSRDNLFVVSGWVPVAELSALEKALSPLSVGITARLPNDDEEPPTLISYPAWARPIAGLFKILSAAAGYREFDPSAMFMVTVPLFAAMLISDWGYSLVLLTASLIAGKKIRAAMGAPFLHLLRIIASAGLIWGLIANSFFGYGLLPITFVPVDEQKTSTDLLMFIAFTLGAIHLTIAWLWQVVRLFPGINMLAPLGWALIVLGMYGLIQNLLLAEAQIKIAFFSDGFPYILGAGTILAVGFRDPAHPLRGILIGLIDLPLSAIGKFGDVMSYVRLMAVGLAGSLLAVRFNEMANLAGAELGIIAQIIILFLGHSLNLALCCIAIFAHGVRLNMLEFSTNLGLTWSGRPFRPLTGRLTE